MAKMNTIINKSPRKAITMRQFLRMTNPRLFRKEIERIRANRPAWV